MSADQLDNASDIETAEREHMIQKARSSTKVQATGHCLYCNAELPNNKRFCDEWCRDDWQLEQDARKRNWR